MHTEKSHVLKNLIWQIEAFTVEKSLPIDEWSTFTGVHTAPGVIVPDSIAPSIMRTGDRWNVGYDDTRYFSADIVVPEDFAGRRVYLNLNIDGESIVRVNGKIEGAVSSRASSGWTHRTEILFHRPLKSGEALHIEVENAVNCGAFCDDAMAGAEYLTYTLKTSYLEVINTDAELLWYDMKNAYEAYECCEDRYVAARIYNALDDAAHVLDFDFTPGRFYETAKPASELLWKKLSEIRAETPGEVYMCGHSHLDVAWLWTVREINRKTARTFSNNISLMKNYPDFKFSQSQAVVYDFMKQRYPDIFEEVKKLVKSVQWEITGNTWVEADTNIASGESLIRQLLYGREFFMREFGVSSDIYWLPDCFGFTWALPQIIKKSGMKYFFTSKLQNNDTNEFPMSAFKWRAHSGDEVLSYMQKVGYEGDADARYVVNARRSNRQNDLVDASMGMYGYGDGGGGCTFAMVENLRRLAKIPGMPQVKMACSGEFFAELEKNADDLPVWDGEMYYENHRGTYTSQAFIKKNNRRGEYLMREAEMLCLAAGGEYPAQELERLWKILLINQFHDILPGTSIHEVVEDTREDYEKFARGVKAVEDCAFAALNFRVAKDNSIVVWNTLPWTVSAIVSTALPFENAAVTDENGRELLSVLKRKNGENTLFFRAEAVPPMGYRIFRLENKAPAHRELVRVTKNSLENEYLSVTLDENGLITAVTDKESCRQILTGAGNVLTVSQDKPIHESAWNLESNYKKKMTELISADSIDVVEQTPLRGVIRVVRSYNKSVITQDIILEAGKKTLDFETTVDWHEREKVLKAQFPVNIRSRYSTSEIAHGSIERPTFFNNSYEQAMFETCAHKWADLSEGGYGVSIINDCKYGYDIHDSLMRITLMRGPICPDPEGDIGISTFRYSLYPHKGTWREADTVRLANIENVPMRAFYMESGAGSENSFSYISVEAENNIIVDAVKKAQDGNGIIIRVYEALSKRSKVTIRLAFQNITVSECNLMEYDDVPVESSNSSFSFTIAPNEVRTFRITQ